MWTRGGERDKHGQFVHQLSQLIEPGILAKIRYNQRYKSLTAGVNCSGKVQKKNSAALPAITVASDSMAQWTEG